MDVCQDYEDLFKLLNTYKVRYLVIGAHAVIFYTEPRYTKDIDLWIASDLDNSNRIYKALNKFGAPLKNISPSDFTDRKMIYQIGVAPVRIDVLIDIPGLTFEKAWKQRVFTKYGKTPIFILSSSDLIRAKQISRRDSDKLDLKKLLKVKKNKVRKR